MIRTTLDDASAHLEDLVAAAVRGEEVLIVVPADNGETVVQIVAKTEQRPRRRQAGSAKGMIWVSDDFDDPLPDFDDYQ